MAAAAARESETHGGERRGGGGAAAGPSDDPLDQLAAAVAAAGNNLGDRACGLAAAFRRRRAGGEHRSRQVERRATFAGAPPRADELSGDGRRARRCPGGNASGDDGAVLLGGLGLVRRRRGGDRARSQAGRLEPADSGQAPAEGTEVEEEQAGVRGGARRYRAQVAGLREEIIAAGGREREQSSVAQKLRRQLDEARGEVAVLKRLREEGRRRA